MSKPSPPPPKARPASEPERIELSGPLAPEQWEALEARAKPGGIFRLVSTSPTAPTVYVIAKPCPRA